MESTEPIHSSSSSYSCCDKSYILTKAGLLRFCIIIFQLAGLVSISCLIRSKYIGYIVATDTQSAYLFFSVIALLFAIVQYILNLTNFIQSGRCRNCKWHLMTGITDILFLLAMFSLGVTCGIKEYELQSFKMFSLYYNYGSYASAAFFAFLCTFCYILSAIFEFRANKLSNQHSQFP